MSDVKLTVRSINAITRGLYKYERLYRTDLTVDDVYLAYTSGRLMDYRNFGVKCLQNVIDYLKDNRREIDEDLYLPKETQKALVDPKVERLKAEADRLGYYIVRKPVKPVPLSPCTCGSKLTKRYVGLDHTSIICSKCGFEVTYEQPKGSDLSPFDMMQKCRKKWNKTIESIEKERKHEYRCR